MLTPGADATRLASKGLETIRTHRIDSSSIMVPIFFRCMSCNHELQLAGEKAGEEIECPECGFVGKAPVPFKGQTASRLRGGQQEKQALPLPSFYQPESQPPGRRDGRPSVSESLFEPLPVQEQREQWNQTWTVLDILYLTAGARLLLGFVTFVAVFVLPGLYLAIAGRQQADSSEAVFSLIGLVAVSIFTAVTFLLQVVDVVSYFKCVTVPASAGQKVLIIITFALSLLSYICNLAIPVLVIVMRSNSLDFSLMEPLLAWVAVTLLNPIALVRWLIFLLYLLSLARELKATYVALGIGGLLIVASVGIVLLGALLVGVVLLSLDPRKSDLVGWGRDFCLPMIWVGFGVTVLWYLIVLRKVRDEVGSL